MTKRTNEKMKDSRQKRQRTSRSRRQCGVAGRRQRTHICILTVQPVGVADLAVGAVAGARESGELLGLSRQHEQILHVLMNVHLGLGRIRRNDLKKERLCSGRVEKEEGDGQRSRGCAMHVWSVLSVERSTLPSRSNRPGEREQYEWPAHVANVGSIRSRDRVGSIIINQRADQTRASQSACRSCTAFLVGILIRCRLIG